MITIAAIKGYPNGTPVPAIQAKIDAVYEHKPVKGQYGDRTVQNIVLIDGGGEKIKAGVWEHPDLAYLKGREVVIQASSKGTGIKVKHTSYEKSPIELEIAKTAKIEPIANTGAPRAVEAPKPASQGAVIVGSGAPVAPKRRGEQVGMIINNAVYALSEGKPELDPTSSAYAVELAKVVKNIAAVTDAFESAVEDVKTPAPTPVSAEVKKAAAYARLDNTAPTVDPNTGEAIDEDVPF